MCCGTPEETLTADNMRTVFSVDAELSVDSKTGRRAVRRPSNPACATFINEID